MSGNDPLVSIVTPTFNSAETIQRTMESVLAQSYKRIEYIVADGDSTDCTMDIVSRYKNRFEKKGYAVKIIRGKDGGMYSGMNKGICQAEGEIIGIVNSDDFYEPDMVAAAVKVYKKYNFDLFYSDLNVVDENGRRIRIKKAGKMRNFYTTRHWNHPTAFIPKRVYDIRMYDESFQYYGDWDFMLWVFKNFDRIAVVHKPLSNFRLGGRTTHQNLKILNKKFAERYRAYRNNGYSRLYLFECAMMDYGKEAVMRMLGK